MTDLDDQQRQLAALRRSARRELELVAEVMGRDAPLLGSCREAWRWREATAAVSLLHGDVANAVVILDRGVHGLRHALDAACRERIPPDELHALLTAC